MLLFRNSFLNLSKRCMHKTNIAQPLRSKKAKSQTNKAQYFVDLRTVRTLGGRGGDGCISFLHLWANENAGPDGGDGGNGGHIIFEASKDVKDLTHVTSVLQADLGEKGSGKNCHGKNAQHTIVKVPIGTIIKNSKNIIIGDLEKDGTMFVAAKGGAGGKGNHFFVSDTEQAPYICEYGAEGEDLQYTLEIRSMAHIGLVGFPNAGKSTLLRAISRARPKVAPYPFTTLKPHLGIVQYDDYEQIAVADLPGIIEDSHKNKGLGIQFLRHAERCAAILIILDVANDEPWKHLKILQNEIDKFSNELSSRTQIIIANKIDLPGAMENVELLRKHTQLPIIPISAKIGTNVKQLLQDIRVVYDKMLDVSNKLDELD
ncbi:mitochondrial ribosome-associated GTPase 2 [Chrysoperla carnea]|uniref:mitochondrial ribosome-associated GTPase 2 n=1 Tax=Chrysoperla carnea TaxID=189513 RepID=UPI001D0800E1|nr:mitochondrial ribosome-associated GTPase 2 [Chrysoperla carnea]